MAHVARQLTGSQGGLAVCGMMTASMTILMTLTRSAPEGVSGYVTVMYGY